MKDLFPIGLCVILPVMIVWLNNRRRQNETNRKTEIMLKAIEAGIAIDADFFNQNGSITIKERLLKRLTGGTIFTLIGILFITIGLVNLSMLTEGMVRDSFTIPCIFGGIFLAIGAALLIVFFVGQKMLAKEIEAEAKSFEQK